MSKTWAAAAPKCISEIGPWSDMLIQRCPWLREMSCLMPLGEAYIMNTGPQAGKESTDGGPLLRSPGSSDLIRWLYRSWRSRTERHRGSSWPPRARWEHSLHLHNIKISPILFLLQQVLATRKNKCVPGQQFLQEVICNREVKPRFWSNPLQMF